MPGTREYVPARLWDIRSLLQDSGMEKIENVRENGTKDIPCVGKARGDDGGTTAAAGAPFLLS